MKEIYEAKVKELLNCLSVMQSSDFGYADKHEKFDTASAILSEYPALNLFFARKPAKHYYKDRLVVIKSASISTMVSAMSMSNDNESKSVSKFDDGINRDIPEVQGLYFIGQVTTNPYTLETFYWLKVGKGTNLRKRLNNYDTHCPTTWRIDISANYELEIYYHHRLKDICLNTAQKSREWFRVDRDTYLTACELGFRFFD